MENTNLNPEMKQEVSPEVSGNYEILYYSKMLDSDELFVTLRFHLPLLQQTKDVTVSMADVKSSRFSEIIPASFTMDDDTPSKKYAEKIREAVFKQVKNQQNIHTLLPQGFHWADNRNVYVIGNYILNRGNLNVCPYNPNNANNFDYSSIALQDAVQWVKLYLNQGPDKAVLFLTALTPYLKTVADFFALPTRTIHGFVLGKSGVGKTSFAKLLTASSAVNLGTDTAALYAALQTCTDRPVLIDDLNLSSSSREMDKKLEKLSTLVQLTSGGGTTIVRGKEVEINRLALIVTAEYLPKSPSTRNRMVLIKCAETFSSEALTELQANKNMFTAFVIAFLEWFLPREGKLRSMIAGNLVKDTFEYKGKCGPQEQYVGYQRIMASNKLLKIACYVLMHFLCSEKAFEDNNELNRIAKILDNGITTAIADTLESVRTDPAESKILSVILDIIHRDPDDIMAKSYEKYCKSDHKLLFRYRDDYYYFRGETLAQYVESKCGEPVALKTLSAELFKANLLVPYGGELSSHLPSDLLDKKSKHKKRYYRMSIPALEDLLEKSYPSYFEKMTSPLVRQRA